MLKIAHSWLLNAQMRRGRLVGVAGTILPGCWCRSCRCRQRRHSLVELISFADTPPAGLVWTKPRCTLRAHDVIIEVAQHFGKIVVKSIFSNIWLRYDWQHDIINKVAVEDRSFGSQGLRRHSILHYAIVQRAHSDLDKLVEALIFTVEVS